jgi:hypothetical protein
MLADQVATLLSAFSSDSFRSAMPSTMPSMMPRPMPRKLFDDPPPAPPPALLGSPGTCPPIARTMMVLSCSWSSWYFITRRLSIACDVFALIWIRLSGMPRMASLRLPTAETAVRVASRVCGPIRSSFRDASAACWETGSRPPLLTMSSALVATLLAVFARGPMSSSDVEAFSEACFTASRWVPIDLMSGSTAGTVSFLPRIVIVCVRGICVTPAASSLRCNITWAIFTMSFVPYCFCSFARSVSAKCLL